MAKTIIMTDVHGCSREFRELINLVRPDYSDDTFVFLGDAIDRGPDDWGVLEQLAQLRWLLEERFIWIMGNHEQKLLDRHPKKKKLPAYDRHDILYFLPVLRELPYYAENEHSIFVHAGFGMNPKKNTHKFMLEDRTVLKGQRKYSGKLYFAGHSPIPYVTYVDPYGNMSRVETGMELPEHGAIFLDTGCCIGGWLSALVIEDHVITVYQVRSRQKVQF
ncbi:MAG: metallophosphoesterase [Erysipelotrichaceae bacterium]|jgi:serine/threonine protein phosphatase 1|nr:metallophosphoesterase [Erysipelotrichaceae bacterium]